MNPGLRDFKNLILIESAKGKALNTNRAADYSIQQKQIFTHSLVHK